MKTLKSLILVAICTLCAASSLGQSQNSMTLTWIENGMYVDMPLYSDGQQYTVKTLVDTGTSFSVIDSAFVVDVLKKEILVEKMLGKTRYHVYIDSICFCGKIIRDVHCTVYELERFGVGDKFIAGALVLENEAWYINRENETITRLNNDSLKGTQIIPWRRSNKNMLLDVSALCPVVKLVFGKKSYKFLFDTGAVRNNTFPKGLVVGTPEEYQSYSMNINMPAAWRTYKRCVDVPFKMGGYEYKGNFTLYNMKIGLLGLGFLNGRSFILNYKQEQLEIF